MKSATGCSPPLGPGSDSSSSSSNDSSSGSSVDRRGNNEARRGGRNRSDGDRGTGGDSRRPVNRDDDNPARDQPDASGAGARGGGRNDGDDDDDRDHGRRRRHRHHRYPRYHQDDTQLYGTSGGGRTQGGTGSQRSKLQDECDRGYEDGLRSGEKDARRGLSSDPQRWTLYRTGGETIHRAGRTAAFKQAYRDCFLRGYEESYRSIRPNSGGASPLD